MDLLNHTGVVCEENPRAKYERASRRDNRGSGFFEKVDASIENFAEAHDPLNRLGHILSDLTVDEAKAKFQKGDHIATMRTAYSHHGIYDGEGGVYEYQDGRVQWNTLESFSNGDKLYAINEDALYSPDEILARARARYGEEDYNVVFNNCDNFATWCRRGE